MEEIKFDRDKNKYFYENIILNVDYLQLFTLTQALNEIEDIDDDIHPKLAAMLSKCVLNNEKKADVNMTNINVIATELNDNDVKAIDTKTNGIKSTDLTRLQSSEIQINILWGCFSCSIPNPFESEQHIDSAENIYQGHNLSIIRQ